MLNDSVLLESHGIRIYIVKQLYHLKNFFTQAEVRTQTEVEKPHVGTILHIREKLTLLAVFSLRRRFEPSCSVDVTSPGGSSWRGSCKNNRDAYPWCGRSGSWGAALRDHFPMKDAPGQGGRPAHAWGKRGAQAPNDIPRALLSSQPPWTSSCNLQCVLEAHTALGHSLRVPLAAVFVGTISPRKFLACVFLFGIGRYVFVERVLEMRKCLSSLWMSWPWMLGSTALLKPAHADQRAGDFVNSAISPDWVLSCRTSIPPLVSVFTGRWPLCPGATKSGCI